MVGCYWYVDGWLDLLEVGMLDSSSRVDLDDLLYTT